LDGLKAAGLVAAVKRVVTGGCKGQQMNNLRRLSDSYQLRAEELRTLAELERCMSTSEQVMGVAHAYDQMMAGCAIARSYLRLLRNEERQRLAASISGCDIDLTNHA
jgi:hypothetical protein